MPRDVGLALRDGGRRVGDAAIALPRGVGRAAAESGRRVGEVRARVFWHVWVHTCVWAGVLVCMLKDEGAHLAHSRFHEL